MRWTGVFLCLLAGCSARELAEPLPFALPAGDPGAAARGQPATERLVARAASVRLHSQDPHAAAAEAIQIAAAARGQIAQNELRGAGSQVEESEVQMSVPQAALDATLRRLRALGGVVSETTSGRDVSDEFEQISERIRTQRTLETRLVALLERSALLKDMLPVEQELARVRADIESDQRKLHALEQAARTASIRLISTAAPPPSAARLADALSRAIAGALSMTEWIITAAGYLLPFALLAFAARAFTGSRSARRHGLGGSTKPARSSAARPASDITI